MNKILTILLTLTLLSCSNNNKENTIIQESSDLSKSELKIIAQKKPLLKKFIDSLKTTSLTYKECKNCNLNGLNEKTLIGFTDRYPPKGLYDRKEIKIGDFDYDSYEVLDSINDERTNGHIYFCYFNKKQKEQFLDFSPYYINKLQHNKLMYELIYIDTTVIIITKIQG